MATSTHNSTAETKSLAATPNPADLRLESLDIFRGLTIAGMILVNDPGSETFYWPLGHADELMTSHPADWYPNKW